MNFLEAFDFLNKGGWVAWVLASMCTFLWYAIGYRFLFLKSQFLEKKPEDLLLKKDLVSGDLLGDVAMSLQQTRFIKANHLESFLHFELKKFWQVIGSHRQSIRAVVLVAPLLGLLGTVIGMIETFDSLKDAALFSQSGGVAGGISQALITTQMGLVVAIPGLLIGKKLDQKEKQMSDFVEQMIKHVSLKKEKIL